MKETIKNNIKNFIFAIIFLFRQAIFYINTSLGYFLVGNCDIFYLLAPIFIYDNLKDKKQMKIFLNLIILAISYIILQMIFLPNYDLIRAIINVAKILVCYCVMMYTKCNVSKLKCNNIIRIFMFFIMIMLILAIIFPESILWRHEDVINKYNLQRLQLLYTEPSELGFHCMIIMLFIVANIISTKNTLKENIIYLLILAAILVLAKPLGAISIGCLSIIIMIIYDWIINYTKTKTKIYCLTMTIILVIIGVLIATNNSLYLRVHDTLNGKDSSNRYRIKVPFNVTKQIIVDTYGIGIGFGNAEIDANVEKYYSIGLREQGIINSYMNFIAESGILGIGIITYLIYYLLKTALKQKDILKIGLITFIVIYQFCGSHFTNPICWIIYGMILSEDQLINLRKRDDI